MDKLDAPEGLKRNEGTGGGIRFWRARAAVVTRAAATARAWARANSTTPHLPTAGRHGAQGADRTIPGNGLQGYGAVKWIEKVPVIVLGLST